VAICHQAYKVTVSPTDTLCSSAGCIVHPPFPTITVCTLGSDILLLVAEGDAANVIVLNVVADPVEVVEAVDCASSCAAAIATSWTNASDLTRQYMMGRRNPGGNLEERVEDMLWA
jgi:hypothetical protein